MHKLKASNKVCASAALERRSKLYVSLPKAEKRGSSQRVERVCTAILRYLLTMSRAAAKEFVVPCSDESTLMCSVRRTENVGSYQSFDTVIRAIRCRSRSSPRPSMFEVLISLRPLFGEFSGPTRAVLLSSHYSGSDMRGAEAMTRGDCESVPIVQGRNCYRKYRLIRCVISLDLCGTSSRRSRSRSRSV